MRVKSLPVSIQDLNAIQSSSINETPESFSDIESEADIIKDNSISCFEYYIIRSCDTVTRDLFLTGNSAAENSEAAINKTGIESIQE